MIHGKCLFTCFAVILGFLLGVTIGLWGALATVKARFDEILWDGERATRVLVGLEARLGELDDAEL